VGKFVLSPQAFDDLDVVWLYIAQGNPEAADRVVEAAYRVCKQLAQHPELGPLRRFPGNDPADIRFFIIPEFPNYLLLYRTTANGVQILRVLQGAQNIDAMFPNSQPAKKSSTGLGVFIIREVTQMFDFSTVLMTTQSS
jgi:toxin ParE1/3/4